MRARLAASWGVSALACMLCVHAAEHKRAANTPEKRLKFIAPVKAGELLLRPTFSCCSVYWGAGAEVPDLALTYRTTDGEWKTADRPPYFDESKDHRGSIFGLAEDTSYEVRLASGDRTLATGAFRTWKSDVPVARTVTIDPAVATFPIRVADRGTPDGWVRYTLPSGKTLVNSSNCPTFIVTGAAYVVFDNMTLRGAKGAQNVITIADSQAVRIRNCDVAGWGRVGVPNYERFGRRFEPGRSAKGYGINYDGAISVGRGAREVVIERCYVHDPAGQANSWFYSHPAGPEAVMMCRPDHSTVIRWCDFVGSDNHRFNDAVESAGNFVEDGGFNRDADVDGNFMIYCNDDNIELDGGQQNVRCFNNRFEGALCGVSIQGCMASPSYTDHNLFAYMGDEFDHAGQVIKTSGVDLYNDGKSIAYVRDNIFQNRGYFNIGSGPLMRYVVTDNVFRGSTSFGGIEKAKRAVVSNNSQGGPNDPELKETTFPVRPLPFILTKGCLSTKIEKGVAAPATLVTEATWTGAADGALCAFTVRQNDDMDWFTVSPASGTIGPGGRVAFTVTLKPERMNDRRQYRGAFLVRTPDGLSRPVSVYATTDFVPPFKAAKPGEFAAYVGPFEPTIVGKKDIEYTFDIPKPGRYYFFVRGYESFQNANNASWPRLLVSVDEDKPGVSIQQAQGYATWTMLTPDRRQGDMLRYYDLAAGRHTVRFHDSEKRSRTFWLEGVAVTDSPGSFEPR